jgi:hypothetical protein
MGISGVALAAPADDAARLIGGALSQGGAYRMVQGVTDEVGPRMAGSPGADRAVEWGLRAMKQAGLTDVHREPVKVSRWVRGEATVETIEPNAQPLAAVALGGSVPTPPSGVVAEVVEVDSLEALAALGPRAKGKIVLFNKPMVRGNSFDSYGQVVKLRSIGAVAAAKVGAWGALIRSAGTGAYRLPHTGATHYEESVPKIPFAAVAAEDAELIHRMLAGGATVRVRMKLTCHLEGIVDSANVVGEVRGREHPEEIVLLGAHLDSWDLGTGAIDDGAGLGIVLDAARLIAGLGAPKRTVRVVFFMNEEHGLDGGKGYAARHAAEVGKHVVAFEADSGAGKPYGFVVTGGLPTLELLRPLIAPLAALKIDNLRTVDDAGSDVSPLQAGGVPVIGLAQDLTTYFDWHHTAADTFDKIDANDLALCAASFAVLARAIADSDLRLPPAPPPQRR